MTKVTIINNLTLKQKILGFAAIAGITLITYTGFTLISRMGNVFDYSDARESIERAVQLENYGLAEQLLEQFDHMLSNKDKVEFADEISNYERFKKPLVEELNQAIIAKDTEKVQELLKKARASLNFSNQELNIFEQKFKKHTEEGLLELILLSEGEEKINLCDSYTAKYENGKHKKRVIKELITEHFKQFYSYINNPPVPEGFKTLLAKTVQLDLLLEQYKNEGIVLNEIIVQEELEMLVEKYLSTPIRANQEVSVGSTVRTLVQTFRKSPVRNRAYFDNRNRAIPPGLTGKVIHSYAGTWFCVEFDPSLTNPEGWTIEWAEDTEHWNGGNKNVASYLEKELQVVVEVNEIDKNNLKQNINAIMQKINTHYSLEKGVDSSE